MLCLAVAVSLLAQLLVGLNSATKRGILAANLADGPPLLDSFSEPGLACAILSHESDRLWWAAQIARANQERLPENRCGGDADTCTQALTALAAEVRDLALDLNLHLMELELDDHSSDAVVDRFLSMLYAAPERFEVRGWVRITLDSAQQCGRVEEVETALRQVIRRYQRLRNVGGLETELDAWHTFHASGT